MATKVYCDVTGEEIPSNNINYGASDVLISGMGNLKGYALEIRGYKEVAYTSTLNTVDMSRNAVLQFFGQIDNRPRTKPKEIADYTNTALIDELAVRGYDTSDVRRQLLPEEA